MYQPVIPWIGGKRRLAKNILPLFPEHTCYVEPFAGGAALFFLKPISEVEVLNDCNNELITLYRVLQHHLEEFIKQFRWALVSRQIYEWLKMTPPETMTDIQRAARFYYLQRMAFGGKVRNQTFGIAATAPPRLNLLRIEEELSQAHIRLARCYIERLDWQKCIEKYDRPSTLFYCDPPYWQTEGYGVPFEFTEYEAMAALFSKMKGRAILSINDHPDIREVFKRFPTEAVPIKYTVGGNGRGETRQELIIKNWG